MMDYIRNAMHASADLKATAKRVRALHDIKVSRAPGQPPMRLFVQMSNVSIEGRASPTLDVPELSPRKRHVHCISRVASWKG